jgi:hypothetical protein
VFSGRHRTKRSPHSLLSRRMLFKRLAIVEITGTIGAAVLGLAMAFRGMVSGFLSPSCRDQPSSSPPARARDGRGARVLVVSVNSVRRFSASAPT